MLEISNLTKVYKGRINDVIALNNVSLKFDQKGLTFILGKSGSGKSTLLNILGMLDTKTKGEIFYNEINYKDFSEGEKDYFRNNEIGFVFQNFNLINEFNVYDNLSVILDLKDKDLKDERIKEILKLVELEGYESRFPQELSAGQQQRVSIARALIKKPKVILADEPTGNVDSKTAKVVLDLFKKISKDILVVIVSHNESDSLKYSDRLIELADGMIIKDLKKVPNYSNELLITNKEVSLPFERALDIDELELLNKTDLTNKIIKQNQSGFINTKEINEDIIPVIFSKDKMFNKHKYARKLYKNRLLTNILSNFIIAFLLSVVIIATFFFRFDLSNKYKDVVENSNSQYVLYNINKERYKTNKKAYILPIEDYVVKELTKRESKIYPIYNIGGSMILNHLPKPATRLSDLTHLGLAVVDMDYLISTFGDENGELNFLYENIESDYDIYVTDLWFSGMLKNYEYKITQINEAIKDYRIKENIQIGAVIKTNFYEKYGSYIDEHGFFNPSDLSEEEIFIIQDEIQFKYMNRFTLNDNFVDDFIKNYNEVFEYKTKSDITDWQIAKGTYTNGDYKYEATDTIIRYDNESGLSNKVILQLNQFNEVFGTNYVHRDQIDVNKYNNIPIEAEIVFYEGDERFVYKDTFTLHRLGKTSNNIFYLSPGTTEVFKMSINVMALLAAPDADQSYISKLEDYNLSIYNSSLLVYNQVNGVVGTFGGIFEFLKNVLSITLLIVLLLFSIQTFRRNMKFIGILKCFGARRYDLSVIYLLQGVINAFFISVFVVLGTVFGTFVANGILEKGIERFLHYNLKGLNIIIINWQTTFIYLGGLLLIFLLSVLLPIILIKRINPIDIVKSRE